MPTKSAGLRIADVRAVHRLVGDCRDLGDDPLAWGARLAEGVGELTAGGTALVGHMPPSMLRAVLSPQGAPITEVTRILTESPRHHAAWGWENGFDPVGYARLAGAMLERGLDFHPAFSRYVRTGQDGIALSRADLVSDRDWYRSEYFRDYHSAAGGDAILMSYRTTSTLGGVWGLVTVRHPGEKDFFPRQKAILAELNAVLVPQIGRALASPHDPSPSQLPPRVRAVLKCLLEGDTDKQIAARLNLTRATVNDYGKRIHRHFRVGSRGELLARWVRRGWPTTFAWDPASATAK